MSLPELQRELHGFQPLRLRTSGERSRALALPIVQPRRRHQRRDAVCGRYLRVRAVLASSAHIRRIAVLRARHRTESRPRSSENAGRVGYSADSSPCRLPCRICFPSTITRTFGFAPCSSSAFASSRAVILPVGTGGPCGVPPTPPRRPSPASAATPEYAAPSRADRAHSGPRRDPAAPTPARSRRSRPPC